jgi:hypothetical protein
MHDEQMAEVKRINIEREKELEDRIYEFNKQKDDIYNKAKKDHSKDETKKIEKFKAKLERVKH